MNFKQISQSIKELVEQGKSNAEHLGILNKEQGETRDEQKKIKEELSNWREKNAVEVMEIKTNIAWIKKFQWLIITTSISTLFGIIFLLIKLVLEK